MTPCKCPSCQVIWEDQIEIPLALMVAHPVHYPTLEIAETVSASYGWTKENRKRFSANVIGIEVQGKYDGISYWQCLSCGATYDRWTMALVPNYPLARGPTS